MHDKTRADVDELIDTIQDLGWEIEGYRTDENAIEMVAADGGMQATPISTEVSLDAELHYNPNDD